MTLREKFKTEVSINTEGEAGRFANKCEQIADDYAIDFAEWMLIKFITSLETGIDSESDDPKELLEIFKKEKGL